MSRGDQGSSAVIDGTEAQVASLADLRFDRALRMLQQLDERSRVALDTELGLANGIDGNFPVEMPTAASTLPGSDRAAAAAVLFLDRFGDLFGIPGWHALSPESASPVGRAIWFTFAASTPWGTVEAHVCADEHVVKHVRIDRLREAS